MKPYSSPSSCSIPSSTLSSVKTRLICPPPFLLWRLRAAPAPIQGSPKNATPTASGARLHTWSTAAFHSFFVVHCVNCSKSGTTLCTVSLSKRENNDFNSKRLIHSNASDVKRFSSFASSNVTSISQSVLIVASCLRSLASSGFARSNSLARFGSTSSKCS